MTKLTPDAEAFRRYKGFDTIPLHRYFETQTIKGRKVPLGKRPLDFNWTKRRYNQPGSSVIARCSKDGRNMGIRLRASELVIDVDPRNGGEEGFADLVMDLGLDESKWPKVITGSGGFHLYGSKPADVLVVDSLDAYPGVEFKSKGRQVVAAGSIHPDTKKYYEFSDDNPPIEDGLPKFPPELIRLITRPAPSEMTGGGQYDQAQLAKALDALDATDFEAHDKWLQLMMACHHATNGEGRHEFIEWSTTDPSYADDAEQIGRRWDSLHTDRDAAVTYRTLNKILADHGAAGQTQSAGDADDDFAGLEEPSDTGEGEGDDDWLEGHPSKEQADDEDAWLEGGEITDEEDVPVNKEIDPESLSWLQGLNMEYMAILEGGTKFRIIKKTWDKDMERWRWDRIGEKDFQAFFNNREVINPLKEDKDNKPLKTPLGTAWLKWPARTTKTHIVFDPLHTNQPKDTLNLFLGWGVQPNPKGSCDRLNEMVFECLCNGNQEYYDYLMNWAADIFQNPDRPSGIATVFRGGQGVGKGTWGKSLATLTGQHGMAISSPELLAGRFNAHFRDLIFLFADEAVKPYDKTADSRLKALITEQFLAIEGKGQDVIQKRNYVHVMMASNEQWVIPADMDARRYFVLDVNDKWKGKFDLWDKLNSELQAHGKSGYGRLLFDLQTRKIPPGWSPARNLPATNALLDQKLQSLTALQHYFFNALMEGVLPFQVNEGDWDKGPVTFFRQDFRDSFSDYCRSLDFRFNRPERGSAYFLLKEVQDLFPDAKTDVYRKPKEERPDLPSRPDGRAKALTIPSLAACREAFNRRISHKIDWGKSTPQLEKWER